MLEQQPVTEMSVMVGEMNKTGKNKGLLEPVLVFRVFLSFLLQMNFIYKSEMKPSLDIQWW